MTAIVILNIVFAAFVVVGILGLLGWGIAKDRQMGLTFAARKSATVTAHPRASRTAARPTSLAA
jgi:hypothetical protein